MEIGAVSRSMGRGVVVAVAPLGWPEGGGMELGLGCRLGGWLGGYGSKGHIILWNIVGVRFCSTEWCIDR